MSELVDAQWNAPAPGSAANIAYFTKQVKDEIRVFFADRNDASNGSIDPVFLLAAYVLEEKPCRSGALTYYGIATGYDVPDNWKIAFAGIRHLASAQSGEDKLAFENLRKVNALPQGTKLAWTKVSLGSRLPRAPALPSVSIVDDLFVPQRSRFATTDNDWFLIGNPIWGTHTIPRLYMMAAIILEQAHQASVVSLVVDKRGNIIAHGIKHPNDSGCAHAEVKAIFSLQGRLPEGGGAIIGTLKPCTMCAGLLHAADPTGKFRKYWVRDDANNAADWSKIANGFTLGNGHQLDNNCANVKTLKVGNGVSFFEQFNIVRHNSQAVADAKKGSPQQESQWYREWANQYNWGSWSNLRLRSGQELQKGSVKAALIEKTVTGPMSLETFINEHLAIQTFTPKNARGWDGLKKEQKDKIQDDWRAYRLKQLERLYPSQVIKIIAWNPASVALSKSVREAFKSKQKKYADPEFRNPIVAAALDYLTRYLELMNVKI